MEPVFLVMCWIALMGAFATQESSKDSKPLYKVEECDCKGKCETILELREEP